MDEAEFWAHGGPPGECWLWPGPRSRPDRFGYGELNFLGTRVRAHRLAYRLAKGPIPPGAHVTHDCDMPACFNPAHLRLGSPATNAAEREARGRGNQPTGEHHRDAKLTLADVEEIRRLRAGGATYVDLGVRFGVDPTTARAAVVGRSWGPRAMAGSVEATP